MSISTHVAVDPMEPTTVFYAKPGNLFTKKSAALANARVIGPKTGQWHHLIETPTHYCRSSRRLSPESISDLRAALYNGRPPTDDQRKLLWEASRAGQLVRLDLHRDTQPFNDVPPTVSEAAAYFEAHFRDGAEWSWITEYYDRAKGSKAVWTVGDTIHADDSRYFAFDLWANHFKEKHRDLYKPQGVRHSAGCRFTRWIAFDVDNHGDAPSVSRDEWLTRYAALHAVLLAEKLPYLAQINPRNGSYQLWCPVNKWPLAMVEALAERTAEALPWVREVYPTRTKWSIICPFRADKLNLLGPGELPKVACRTKTRCYDLVAAWRWHRRPIHIDVDAVSEVLARSFPTSRATVKVTEDGGEADGRQEVRSKSLGQKPKSPTEVARGKFGPLRGRWLDLLSDTYLDGVEPPEGSVVSFLTPQLRLFRTGETETARSFLKDSVAFMNSKNWTFSDRVQNDPEALVRSLEAVCRGRNHATDRPLDDVDKTRDRLDTLGFDGSFATLLDALSQRRSSGRRGGIIDRAVVENDYIAGVAVALAHLTKTDRQTAVLLLRRILNHIDQRQELSYSLLKMIASSMNIRLSNYKMGKVFKIFTVGVLIVKTKNYSRCSQWSIGNFYAVTDKVRFEGESGGSEYSCNNTISRFPTTETPDDPEDLSEYADEVARLRIARWTANRIRTSRKNVR